jgi:hypothetical protein
LERISLAAINRGQQTLNFIEVQGVGQTRVDSLSRVASFSYAVHLNCKYEATFFERRPAAAHGVQGRDHQYRHFQEAR